MAGDIDFETSENHSVFIRATDKGEKFKEASFSVTVVDVNDKPTVGIEKSANRHHV